MGLSASTVTPSPAEGQPAWRRGQGKCVKAKREGLAPRPSAGGGGAGEAPPQRRNLTTRGDGGSGPHGHADGWGCRLFVHLPTPTANCLLSPYCVPALREQDQGVCADPKGL